MAEAVCCASLPATILPAKMDYVVEFFPGVIDTIKSWRDAAAQENTVSELTPPVSRNEL
jgi:hypothetical protein